MASLCFLAYYSLAVIHNRAYFCMRSAEQGVRQCEGQQVLESYITEFIFLNVFIY